MLEAKESMLARWKEEAQLMSSKLDRAMNDNKLSLEERQYDVMSLRQQVGWGGGRGGFECWHVFCLGGGAGA